MGRGIGGLEPESLGIPAEPAYLERYLARSGKGRLAEVQRDWDFYLAYNLFRIAAILQGIARRVVDGTAASAEAASASASARPLAVLAWSFASRA
jgi:aminoglycoside phosphotransferase (APT) family kinase protein